MKNAVNLSGTATVDTRSRYYLDRIDPAQVSGKTGEFVRNMLQQGKIIYDWGQHYFFSCSVPFEVDYDEKNIFNTGSKTPVEDEQFHGCDPDELHETLRDVFEGQWGPTAVDVILRLENSGIRVEPCNTAKFGPPNPKVFIEELRKDIGK